MSLVAQYSDKGRKGYNPIMMFAVLTYANMRGVKAIDQIVELYERDIAFIWLTKGQRPKRDVGKNKVMKINENWEELKSESHANIQSEKGIFNRQIRSIQTEGHFADIKGNNHFRRFNYRSEEKVSKEFMLYVF